MGKFYNSFSFVGDLLVPNDEKKLFAVQTFDSGAKKASLKVGVKESKVNGIFVTAEGWLPKSENDVLKRATGEKAEDGSQITVEIPYKDRLTQAALDSVANFCKSTVDLETDQEVKKRRFELINKIRNREEKEMTDENVKAIADYKAELAEKSKNVHEFITDLDFIEFIRDNVETLKKHKVKVTGNVTKSEYKGKSYINYVPNKIEIVPSDYENRLLIIADLYFDKSAVDDVAFEDSKKLLINGYLMNRDNVVKADRFYPQQFIINANKVNFEDAGQVELFNFLKGLFTVDGDNFYHLTWEVNAYRGAETKEFTYDDLTPTQKALVDMNVKNVEDFKPRGQYLGGNVDELLLIMPRLEGEFSNGAVDTTFDEETFASLIAASTGDVSLNDVKKDDTPKQEEPKPQDDMASKLKGLFGN